MILAWVVVCSHCTVTITVPLSFWGFRVCPWYEDLKPHIESPFIFTYGTPPQAERNSKRNVWPDPTWSRVAYIPHRDVSVISDSESLTLVLCIMFPASTVAYETGMVPPNPTPVGPYTIPPEWLIATNYCADLIVIVSYESNPGVIPTNEQPSTKVAPLSATLTLLGVLVGSRDIHFTLGFSLDPGKAVLAWEGGVSCVSLRFNHPPP